MNGTLVLIFSIATVLNIIVIYWKLRHDAVASGILDMAILALLAYTFSNSVTGLAIATVSSALFSIYLFFDPPSFPSIKRDRKKHDWRNSPYIWHSTHSGSQVFWCQVYCKKKSFFNFIFKVYIYSFSLMYIIIFSTAVSLTSEYLNQNSKQKRKTYDNTFLIQSCIYNGYPNAQTYAYSIQNQLERQICICLYRPMKYIILWLLNKNRANYNMENLFGKDWKQSNKKNRKKEKNGT